MISSDRRMLRDAYHGSRHRLSYVTQLLAVGPVMEFVASIPLLHQWPTALGLGLAP